MRTDDLIADLAGRAARVRPLPPPGTRTLAWFTMAIASAGLGVTVFGARSGVDALLADSEFLLTGMLAFGTALFAIFSALVLAIPGAERTPAPRVAAIVLVGLWATMLVSSIALAGVGMSGVSDWYVCFVRVAAIGLIPAAAVIVMIRRAMPLRTGWTNALALAGAAAIGAFAIQFICPLSDAGHSLLGHLGPVLMAAVAGAALGLKNDLGSRFR